MKDFVPYQEALALKELEFDEPCFGYFHPIHNELLLSSMFRSCYPNNAPTYSQAFRFFREKYGLIGWVEGKRFYKFCIESFIPTDDQLNLSPFPTYEVAELACLKKLIEIVKNKAI